MPRFIPSGPLAARPVTALPNALYRDDTTGKLYQYWNNGWQELPTETIDPTNIVTFDDKATTSKLGVMKVGTGLTASSGKVSLSVATADAIGGVKPGTGLAMGESGALNLQAATASAIGGVGLVANQTASTASDLAGLVTDFNTLLAALKAAGVMAADSEG